MKVMELDENAGVKSVKDLHAQLSAALREESEVMIDLGKLRRLDGAIVQLLIAAGWDARAQKKVLRLRSASDGIRRQLELCGIVK